MRKIIFLVNPISGSSRKDAVLKYIERVFKREKIDFEIISTDPSGNYDFLKYKIQDEDNYVKKISTPVSKLNIYHLT